MTHALESRSGPARQDDSRELLLLATGTPLEVLARIVPGDPLGLRARIATLLAERALLLDVERVLLRAQALCALRAGSWRGAPPLERWKDERVEEALASLLADEHARTERHEPLPFAACLGLDAPALARACAGFNTLPFSERRAFVALVLDADGPDLLAHRLGVSLSEVARRARVALELLLDARAAPTPSGCLPESGGGTR